MIKELSRRNFLKVSGLALAASAFMFSKVSGSDSKADDCSTCVNVGDALCPKMAGRKTMKDNLGFCGEYEPKSNDWDKQYGKTYVVWDSNAAA